MQLDAAYNSPRPPAPNAATRAAAILLSYSAEDRAGQYLMLRTQITGSQRPVAHTIGTCKRQWDAQEVLCYTLECVLGWDTLVG